MEFYKRNYIEGLFLSSGIIQNSDYTMEQLIDVAKRLRQDQHFGGYIHLKTIPGADQKLIDEAGLWADRLSVNIELPTEADLARLAPEKKKPEIVTTMNEIRGRIDDSKAERARGFRAPRYAPAGQSTQMIVGATATTDQEILRTSSQLYTASVCAEFTIRPTVPFHTPTRACPAKRRRWCASIGCIKPTGCCATTTSKWTRSQRLPTGTWT